MMRKLPASFEKMLEGGSSADVVAKVVLKAATSENPSPMYLAGRDIETWMEAKRSMSDEEFHKMMKEFDEVEHREKKSDEEENTCHLHSKTSRQAAPFKTKADFQIL